MCIKACTNCGGPVSSSADELCHECRFTSMQEYGIDVRGDVTPAEITQHPNPVTFTLRSCDMDEGWLKGVERLELNKKNSIVRNPCLPKRWKKGSKYK